MHYLDLFADELIKRIQKRALENPPISKEKVIEWFALFQPPDEQEQALYDSSIVPSYN